MNKYTVIHLRPKHAQLIAKLERRIYSPEQRSGKEVIWAQLAEAEHEGENFSLGLCCSNRLVGFFLLFALGERRQMCEYFDVDMPAALDPQRSVLYVADFGVLPNHRQAIRQFSRHWSKLLSARPDIREMALDAFATEELADFWLTRMTLFMGLGWQLNAKYRFDDAKLRRPMVWLCFEPRKKGRSTPAAPHDFRLEFRRRLAVSGETFELGIMRSSDAWSALKPYWDGLLEKTTEPSMLQTCAVVQRWWSRFGYASEPWIAVALRNGTPAAIAPLQITPMRRWGRVFKVLTWIHELSGAAEPLMSTADRGGPLERALAEFIAQEKTAWDYLWLSGTADSAFLVDLGSRLHAAGLLTAQVTKLRQIPQPDTSHPPRGRVELFKFETPETALKGLKEYLSFELSQQHTTPQEGRLANGAALAFCHDLALECSPFLLFCVLYWHRENKLVGGCCGMVWKNRFFPLRSLGLSEISEIDLPFPFRRSKISASDSVMLAAAPATLTGWLLHAMHVGYPTLSRVLESMRQKPQNSAALPQLHMFGR